MKLSVNNCLINFCPSLITGRPLYVVSTFYFQTTCQMSCNRSDNDNVIRQQ